MMTNTWALAILLQPALGEKSINIFGHIEFNRICCFCREEFGSHSIGFIEACCILLFLNKKIKNGMHFFFFFSDREDQTDGLIMKFQPKA